MASRLVPIGPDTPGHADRVKICALMSIPRVGWSDSWGCAHEALLPFGIPIRRFTGAYWHQCLQDGLERCVADGADWVICIDYDSLFTVYDVDRLMSHLGGTPEADAIAALQCRRSHPHPLLGLGGSLELEVQLDKPFRVDTAHFGLTILRMEALVGVPKPWLFGKPNESGGWSDGRVDPDIWFWHRWRDAGKTVYVAPDVRIGHLELLVSCYNAELKPQIMGISEWRRRAYNDPDADPQPEVRQLVEDSAPA